MGDTKQNIFSFNHIDTTLSNGTIEMLKNLYAYYHKNTMATTTCIENTRETI